MSKLKIVSQNLRGIRTKEKALKFVVELERHSPDFYVCIDTHLNEESNTYLKNIVKGYDIHSNLVVNESRGVSILVRNSLDIEILDKSMDRHGNVLALKFKHDNNDIVLVGSYGPNRDSPNYFEDLFK